MSGALLAASIVLTPLALARNKSLVSGSGSGFAVAGDPGSTDSVTMTASGGTSPYTYAWTQLSGNADPGPYKANSPTSATSTFADANNLVADNDVTTDETWRCTVTDNVGRTATNAVTVRLTWVDLS